MKRDENFLLHTIAAQHVIVPVGEACRKLNGMMTVNESGKLLWERLAEDATEEELCEALCSVYDITPEQAREDISDFLADMRKANCLIES